MAGTDEPDADASRPTRAGRAGWVMYDLANTIFSFNVITLYFPGWVKEQLGGTDADLGFALGTSMLLVAIVSPIMGAASDRAGRRLHFLVASTLLCVTATATIAFGGLPTVLVLYAVANFFFQLGLVFYDSMLPDVSTPDDVGSVGGAGIGIGYVGSFIGLGSGILIIDVLGYPTRWVFLATAVLFLVFALPIFIFYRDPPRPRQRASVTEALAGLKDTARAVLDRPPLARFLASRFVYTDVANTMIAFMVPYAIDTGGYTLSTAQPIAGAAIAAAIVGGFGFGRAVDHWSAKPVLQAALVLWVATLAGAIAIPLFDLPQWTFWMVAGGAGMALGGTWASDRPLMLELTPPGRVGEFYGVYGMVGRFAAVVGPFLWGLIAVTWGFGQPWAVAVLLVLALVSMAILATVEPGRPVPALRRG